jgi:superoxide reductase
MSVEQFRGIHVVRDVTNSSEGEREHFPTIEAPDVVTAGEPFEVTVGVGAETPHPNDAVHHILWVELFAGETFLARADFTPVVCGLPVRFTLRLEADTTLKALARCNLHGLWEGSRPLRVRS